MESVLDELCSRIYDIQMCIECAVNGGADKRHIQELTTKMCKIEKELQLIEEEVNAQLPLIERVDTLVEYLQSIHSVASEIQVPEDEIIESEDETESEKEEPKPKPKTVKHKKSESSVRSSIPKPSTQKKEEQRSETPELFRNVDDKDIKHLKMYRVSATALNKVIDEMNELLQRKAKIMKSKRGIDDPLFRDVSEDLEQGFGISITSNDIHDLPNLKKNPRKFFAALNELGMITSSQTGSITRHYPK